MINWKHVSIVGMVCGTLLIMFFNMEPRRDPPFWQMLLLAPYINN